MKRIFIVVLLLLSVGFVAAHGIYANMDGGLKMKSVDKIDYKYFSDYHFYREDFSDWDKRGYYDDWSERKKYGGLDKRDSGERYYREYVPHLRSYVEGSCYTSAPADKLFYIKC